MNSSHGGVNSEAEGWIRRYAYRKLGRYRDAIADYGAAIEVSPSSVRLYNNRGYCHAKLSQYDAAIEDYSQVRTNQMRGVGIHLHGGPIR